MSLPLYSEMHYSAQEIELAVLLINLKCANIDKLEDRILLQKKIYLLISMNSGIDLNYKFNWYLHGPYCPELANDAFKLFESSNNLNFAKHYHLSEAARKMVEKVNKYDGLKPQKYSLSRWYELIASVYFVYCEYNVTGVKDREKIIGIIRANKPQYKLYDIDLAFQTLELNI